jgi:hypothetical protein
MPRVLLSRPYSDGTIPQAATKLQLSTSAGDHRINYRRHDGYQRGGRAIRAAIDQEQGALLRKEEHEIDALSHQ